jgi:hypothetical protein
VQDRSGRVFRTRHRLGEWKHRERRTHGYSEAGAGGEAELKSAQRAATRKRTIANLPAGTRRELGEQAARGRSRSGQAGHALEDRNRRQLYELAQKQNIRGRSKMGKWELIEALRRRR